MVRKGLLAFLVVGTFACTEAVDDPADFTAGNSAANSSSSSGAATDGPGNSSGVADNGNDGTTAAADGTTSGTPETTTGTPGTDSGGNTGNCGNGAIDAGEQCDGADLQGFDCASLGLSGGTLACDPVMCTFDTSMCTAGPGTSG